MNDEEFLLAEEEAPPPAEEEAPPPAEEEVPPPAEEDAPPPAEEEAPPPVEEEALPPAEEEVPPPAEEEAPPPAEEEAPPPVEEEAPPPVEEEAPPPAEEEASPPAEEEAPPPSEGDEPVSSGGGVDLDSALGSLTAFLDTRERLSNPELELMGIETFALSPVTSSTGLKGVLLDVLGPYDNIVTQYKYQQSNNSYYTYVNEVTPDYPWIASAALFIALVVSLFSLLKRSFSSWLK